MLTNGEHVMTEPSTDATKDLVATYLSAWGEEQLTKFPDILAEDLDASFVVPTGGVSHLDADGVRETWTNSFASRSDPDVEIHRVVAEHGWAMAHVTYSYTHDEAEFGVAPTGNRVDLEEYLTFRVEDDEIVKIHSLANDLSRLRQLGIEIPIES